MHSRVISTERMAYNLTWPFGHDPHSPSLHSLKVCGRNSYSAAYEQFQFPRCRSLQTHYAYLKWNALCSTPEPIPLYAPFQYSPSKVDLQSPPKYSSEYPHGTWKTSPIITLDASLRR